MGFTAPVITHSFENADGTSASGSIEFTLSGRITNGTKTIVPAPLTSALSGEGLLSQAITSNLDAGTNPVDTQWRVDFRILGITPAESFYIVVPPIVVETNGRTFTSETVQLNTLTANPLMIGQSITGSGIAANTTITAVNTTTNQVTLSAPATASASGLTLTIGATIDLGSLLPAEQQVA